MEKWIKELLNGFDEILDETQKQDVLKKCGEKCPFTHLPDKKLLELKNQSTSEIDFLNKLCEHWRLEKNYDRYYVVFDQCYCPLVKGDNKETSKTLCYCTLGNIQHKFRIGLGREVEIVMEKTVLAGDKECRFLIKI